MCRVIGVSRSGYYSWLGRDICTQELRSIEMEEKARETYEEFEAIYGARRITKKLNDLGTSCSTNYVAAIMANQDIKARNSKGFIYRR